MSMSIPYYQSDLADKLIKQMKKLNRTARIVYFPMEDKHSIWVDGERIGERITDMHESAIVALNEGIAKLKDAAKSNS